MERWDRRRFINAAAIAAGSGLAGWHGLGSRSLLAQAQLVGVPEEILNPVEVSGADAEPVMGKLPGQKRMYVLPADAGEFYRVGGHTMKRIARAADTGDVHELATFTGNTGATMPRHAHLSSHAAVLVLRGEVEFELAGDRWTMMRGDFANLPPGTPPSQAVFAQTPMRFFDPRFDAPPLFAGAEPRPEILMHLMAKLGPTWDVTAGPDLRTPLLIAHGRHDYTVPHVLWDDVIIQLPTATKRIFERSGHQPFVEEPDRFTTEVTAWLGDSAGKPASR